MVAGRDDDDPLVVAVGPVSETAAGELARRLLPADAFIDAPLPQRVPGDGVDGERLAARGGDGEDAPLGVERRRAVVLILAVPSGLPSPRDLERVEVRRVDLVGRGVPRAPGVGAPVAPLEWRITADERGLLRDTLADRRDDGGREDRGGDQDELARHGRDGWGIVLSSVASLGMTGTTVSGLLERSRSLSWPIPACPSRGTCVPPASGSSGACRRAARRTHRPPASPGRSWASASA